MISRMIGLYLGFIFLIGVGSVYDQMASVALTAQRAYQSDQLSYSKFTKAMTEAKPRKVR